MKLSYTEKFLIVANFVIWAVLLINHSPEPTAKSEKYVIGYLKAGFGWVDNFEDVYHMTRSPKKVYRNKKDTKIEIWDLNDEAVVMIFFLEGEYSGRWGYTVKNFTRKIHGE